MLALSPGVGYVHEPFNVERWPGWPKRPLPHWFLYVSRENQDRYADIFDEILGFRYPLRSVLAVRDGRHAGQVAVELPLSLYYRAARLRPLIKDPIAVMSSEWLAERYGMRVVVMIRHPAAFAGSLKRLDWQYDFRNWADQPLLLRDLLGPYEEQIRDYAERRRDILDQAILMWNVIHHAILQFRERHPDWSFIRHEDLAEEPLKGFRDLYERLDLQWDHVAEDAIVRFSTDTSRKEVPTYLHRTVRRDSKAARWTWTRRLTREEQDRVRAGTEDVARHFYGDEDWTPSREEGAGGGEAS